MKGELSLDFDEVYNEVAAGVYRYLRRLTGSRARAEDILQETFIRLHAQLNAGVTISHPRAWLFQVATNLSKDEQRHAIRAAVREENYSAQAGNVVLDFPAQIETQQIVRRALEELTPRMRQLLLLFSEGFTYREISEIAGVEPAYVGVLLQRGRAAFKKHYEHEQELKVGERYKPNSL